MTGTHDAVFPDLDIFFEPGQPVVAASDELNIRKLVAGRIDAFVLDEKAGIKAAKALGRSDAIQHDRLAPVSRQDVYVASPPNDRGHELAGRMSEALRQLKASGRYQAITQSITIAQGCSGRRRHGCLRVFYSSASDGPRWRRQPPEMPCPRPPPLIT